MEPLKVHIVERSRRPGYKAVASIKFHISKDPEYIRRNEKTKDPKSNEHKAIPVDVARGANAFGKNDVHLKMSQCQVEGSIEKTYLFTFL